MSRCQYPPPNLLTYTTLFRSPSEEEERERAHRAAWTQAGRALAATMVPEHLALLTEEELCEDGLPPGGPTRVGRLASDRKSTRLNSSHANISYAVFCL